LVEAIRGFFYAIALGRGALGWFASLFFSRSLVLFVAGRPDVSGRSIVEQRVHWKRYAGAFLLFAGGVFLN